MIPRRSRAVAHLSFATVGLVGLAGVIASAGMGPSHVALTLVAAFVPYSVLFASGAPIERATGVRLGVALAALSGAALLAAPPVLSDDLYRYLWDGRVLVHGIDPYLYAPNDAALAPLRDASWARINYPEIPTIYPPGAQALFALTALLGGTPVVVKALALAAHLAVIVLVAELAGEARGGRAALLYAVNPLALAETALAGHVDVFAGLAIVGFVLALLARRPGLAALLALAASGVKLVGIALAPLGFSRGRRASVLAVALALVPLAPLLAAGRGSHATPGVGHYAQRWRGNEGLFGVVELGARVLVEEVARMEHAAPGHVRLPALAPLLELLAGTPFDPWATQAGEKKAIVDRTDFQADYVATMLARAIVLALVLGLAVFLGRRDDVGPLTAARIVLFATLLLAPQVHPWYLLWLLPLELAAGGVAGVVWSAAVLVAYAPLASWIATRTWNEALLPRAFEHVLVLGVLAAELQALGLGKNRPTLAVQGS